jgi:enoyl-CoA hydratase/carnithine racemase
MSDDDITYERRGSIALIGLNRSNKRNAISEAVVRQIHAAAQRANDEADAAVVFGHGTNFSAGLDLAEMAARIAPDAPRARRPKPNIWHAAFDVIARGGIPFVAALHGATIGGGLELAAAAHIRVADETTVFGLPEGQRGIFVGGGGSVRIQRLIGYAAMADMMLTGRMLTASEALMMRLVQYVVAPGDALERAIAIAERIAENTPQTNWKIVNVLSRVNDLAHDDGLFVEAMAMAMAKPPETLQRLNDFVEKRAQPLEGPIAAQRDRA